MDQPTANIVANRAIVMLRNRREAMIMPPIVLVWFAVGIGTAAAAQDAYWRAVLASLGNRPVRRPAERLRSREPVLRGITNPYLRRQFDPHYHAPSRTMGGGRGH
jgi:hypothetical protein